MKCSNINKVFPCFTMIFEAFRLLLSRIEQIIYFSIPIALIKILLFSGTQYFLLSSPQANIMKQWALVGVIFLLYGINSFASTVFFHFLQAENNSLTDAYTKTKLSFRRTFFSDLTFLGLSLLFLGPILWISLSIPIPSSVLKVNTQWIGIILAFVWFCVIFIPYHGIIRPHVVFTGKIPFIPQWIQGYKLVRGNYSWMFPYYGLFGILYILLNPGITTYYLLEIFLVIALPFQVSVDLVSYKKFVTRKEF